MKENEPLKPEDITPETFPKADTRIPALAGLPEYLKDPEVYPKIQRALLETLASKHSHGDMAEWASCFQCQNKMHEHAELMRKLGFTSPAQYRAWVNVHEKIARVDPLVDWKELKK